MGGVSTRSDFVVRTARTEDYDRLGSVFDEAEAFHRHALPDVFQKPPDRFPSRELWQSVVSGPASTALVAERPGGDLVAFVAIRTVGAPEDPMLVARRTALVDLLAVRSDQQRLGIGKALMAAVHSWALERDLEEVVLNVWEFNQRAVRFYQALGYTTASRMMRRSTVSARSL